MSRALFQGKNPRRLWTLLFLVLFALPVSWARGEETQVSGIEELREQGQGITGLNQPRFHSIGEFFRDLWDIGKLIRQMEKSGYELDPKFRETICLTVTYANNCGP